MIDWSLEAHDRWARPKRPVCNLCGNYIGDSCDGSQASHDGDGNEPCGPHGHYRCSTNGRTGGPCSGEVHSQWHEKHPDEECHEDCEGWPIREGS